jgi:hypothetical protein
MNWMRSHAFASNAFASYAQHGPASVANTRLPPESMAAGNGGAGRRAVNLPRPPVKRRIVWSDDEVAIATVLAALDDF